MWKIFAVAFVLMVFNSILTYKQAKDFTISFNEIRKYGNVSVGKDKQYFIYGVILILACDNNGYVTKYCRKRAWKRRDGTGHGIRKQTF